MNLKLCLEYDGSKFYGWQYQPGLRTVQGEVERALKVLLRETIHVKVAGRTDAGVHALGQVINFQTEREIELKKLPRSLNGILPHDVVVASEISEDAETALHQQLHRWERICRWPGDPAMEDL